MSHVTIKSTIAALVISSALLVPAASAQPIDPPGVGITAVAPAQANSEIPFGVERAGGGANPTAQSRPSNPASASGTRPSGFDWGDAAIGAAGTLIIVILSAAGVVAVRRNRGHGQPALTS